MPASCCASGCSNSVTRGKRMFRIPLSEKDSARREVWLAIIKRPGFVPTSGSRLCEDHFEPDQFEQHRADGRKLLKHNAVPTIPGSAIPAGQKRGRHKNRRTPSSTKRRRLSSDSVDDGDSDSEEEVDHSSGPEAAEAADTVQSANTRGPSDWADALTSKALQIRFAAGQRGYAVVREMCLGFPSELQLRQRVEALPFEPGVLDGLLPALEHKVSTMRPEDRHVALRLERVAVLPGSVPTLGGTDDESSGDALVFSVAGLASYWKQALGYHLLTELVSSTSTGGSALCGMLKNAVFRVVRKCEALGLAVDALVTDLSAPSLSLWKQCGVSTRPLRRPVFSIRHPCTAIEQSDHRRLMILTDLPYVMKSIVDALIENETLLLPGDVVEKHGLPTDKVCFDHIRSLFATNNADNLGFVRVIELDCLRPECMRKDTSISNAVLNQGTVTGLRCLRAVKVLPKEAETTAWFVEQVDRWCSLMMSMPPGATDEQCKGATAFLHEFKDTFSRVSPFSQTKEEGELRVAKIGLCVSTAVALKLHEILVVERQVRRVLISRGTSASLQRVLGTVCQTSCVPSHTDFRSSLHTMCLAQLFLPVRNGASVLDESGDIAEFISAKPSENSDESCTFMAVEKCTENSES